MKKKRKFKLSSRSLTVLLLVALILIVAVNWSLFISGPSRIHEQDIEQKMALIEKNNEDIQGLTRHVFKYVTYQGYTTESLYWYDDNGDLIVEKDISDLDYDEAKKVAEEDYGVDCESIVLGYGYNNPCYEIRGKDKMILIDFDTFVRVYEREL